MISEPKLLSECGTHLVVDSKDEYHINIEEGTHQLIVMGFESHKAGAKFTHPNIIGSAKKIHEFKHYRKHGSKFWTAKAGVDHYLAIPRNKIYILPEKGYSYIPAEINGVKIRFNVSGGTFNGWTDRLGIKAHISVNHKLSDLKKLCEVAERETPFEECVIPEMDVHEEFRWNQLSANANPKIKEAIAKLIEEDKAPVIKLMDGFYLDSGYGITVRRRWKKNWTDNTHYTLEEKGALKSIVGMFDNMRYKIKSNQIDWHRTALANKIS